MAAAIIAARAGRVLLDPLSDTRPLTLGEAYDVQRRVLAARLARGERHVGWKLGYTSEAMRAQMGIDHPNFAPLTDVMVLRSGEAVPDDVVQPRVEPEIALVLGAPLGAGADRWTALACVSEARCALEVVDPVWRDYRFRIEDNTADGSSAVYVVLGPAFEPDVDLADVPVTFRVDHTTRQSTGAAAMGHPADALAWLAGALSQHGLSLQPGDVVITGGLTKALPLGRGSTASATFAGTRTVSTARPA